MKFGEIIAELIFLISPILFFEYLRNKYMMKHFKLLITLVNNKDEYENYSKKYMLKAHIFRIIWIIWTLTWGYLIFLTN